MSLSQVGDLAIFLMMIQSSGAYMLTLLAVLEGSSNKLSVGYCTSELKKNYWIIKIIVFMQHFRPYYTIVSCLFPAIGISWKSCQGIALLCYVGYS